MATSFPKLPGYVPIHDCTKTDWKKVSHVKQEANKNPKNAEVPLYALPRKPEAALPPPKDPKSMSYSQTVFQNPKGADIREKFEPTFSKLDKQVLRFYGYFKESVTESALESFRIRKVVALYYLDDSTIGISEPKMTNSGAPQGILLKRQMVLKSDDSGCKIGPTDFVVGQDITIYGKTFHIYDCDQYTREFCANIGMTQGAPEDCPKDSFTKKPLQDPIVHDRDFNEHYLGGVRIQSQKQFLDNDRKVLRFFTRMEALPYIVHYFLADDTIEILEVHFANDGCAPYPAMLKRQKMLKKMEGMYQPGQIPLVREYIIDADFFPDKNLEVYSKSFEIVGVDAFTQEYYMTKFGRKFPISKLEATKPGEPVPLVIPPYNGFGDEDDSLGYVYRLDPKPPKKDFFKFVDNDKVILRYTAKMNTTVPEDIDRRFIICYYLADNSLSIFETPRRNSGTVEGKFLERRKYKNATGLREFIEPSDLAVGGNVIINAYPFQILSCDEYTQNWMKKSLI